MSDRRSGPRRWAAAAIAFVLSLLALMLIAAGAGVTFGSVEVLLMLVLATIVSTVVYRRGSRSTDG